MSRGEKLFTRLWSEGIHTITSVTSETVENNTLCKFSVGHLRDASGSRTSQVLRMCVRSYKSSGALVCQTKWRKTSKGNRYRTSSHNLALQQLRPSCAPVSGNPTWPYPFFILDTCHLKPIIICEKSINPQTHRSFWKVTRPTQSQDQREILSRRTY